MGPIISQFQAATGIDVAVKYGSTAQIAATLLEEGQNSPADVFFAQDPGGLGAVANEGILSALPAEITDLVPAWARSPEGKWVGLFGSCAHGRLQHQDPFGGRLAGLRRRLYGRAVEGTGGLGADQRLVPSDGHGDASAVGRDADGGVAAGDARQ